MYYIMLVLCAIFFTATIFLIGRFGIKRNDNVNYISDIKNKNDD